MEQNQRVPIEIIISDIAERLLPTDVFLQELTIEMALFCMLKLSISKCPTNQYRERVW